MDRFNALSRNGKIGVGCGGLIALAVLCSLCSQLLGGGSQPPPTPTPEVQPLVAPVDEATVEPTATEESEATATERPSDMPEPTVEPTAIPPTDAPTAVPPTPIPATAAPAFAYDPPCQDTVNCADFSSRGTDPQLWWNARRSAECPNPGQLDGDNDNSVCEEGEGGRAAAPPPAAPPAGCININTASFDELRQIIHIEEAMAQQIIAIRPFRGWNDFEDRVDGIGKAKREDIQNEGKACIQ